MTCLKTNRNIGASTGSACWLVTCHPLLVLACQLSSLLVTCHPCPSVAFFICHLSFFADHSSGTAAAEVLLSNICTVDSIYLFVMFICHFHFYLSFWRTIHQPPVCQLLLVVPPKRVHTRNYETKTRCY